MQYTQLQRTVIALMSSALLSLTALAQVQKPDLIVESVTPTGLTVNPQNLQIGGTVEVTLKNVGTVASPACSGIIFSDRGTLNGVYDAGTDVVHGVFSAPALAVGASASVSASVSGQVRFVGALLYAYVDDANTVDEINEGNNLSNTGFRCRVARTGQFDPELKWKWDHDTVIMHPNALNVPCTPVVADLDRDGIPEVIFSSTPSNGGSPRIPGYLRILDGRTGREKYTSTVMVDAAFNPSVGDIDGDGLLEVITVRWDPYQLIALDHQANLKVEFEHTVFGWCGAAAIANIDGTGNPEVIFGNRVYNSDGTLRWQGLGGRGTYPADGTGPFAYAADIDLDGQLDVIAGNTIYNNDGTRKYPALQGLPDGATAIANFDSDPYPELVIVSNGRVYLVDHDLTRVIWSVSIPGNRTPFGGTPTIANLDDDPDLEIGVAGDSLYVILDHDGSVKRTFPVSEREATTGSTVFDFDGDGTAEILYADQLNFFVFRAENSIPVTQIPNGSCTWTEMPIVADVDGDASADIVVVRNNNCGLGSSSGVRVFHSRSRSWVPTRSIWNQHAYSITNVNDDGSIPAYPTPNWLVPEYNNFRCNVQGSFPAAATPDLTASFLRRCPIPDTNGDFNFVLRIGNGGAGPLAPTTIAVDFYRGDPDNGGQFLQRVSVNTQTLQPDQYQDVVVSAPDGIVCSDVYAVVDADGQITECNETNNKYGLYIPIPGDVNVDRIVDDADLLEILFDFGRVVGADEVVPADINCDGIVDDADLLIALFNFGEECP